MPAHDERLGAHRGPASESRQGRKAREVGHQGSAGTMGIWPAAASESGVLVRPWSDAEGGSHMHYAILCYDSETVVGSWTKEEDDALMARQAVVEKKLAADGKLGPVVRLMPTTTATTLRKAAEPLIIDVPL